MKRRVIIADDHPVVLQGLRRIVSRAAGIEVVGQARDGAVAEQLARSVPADLLVLDVALPVCSGIRVLESLRRDGITLPVLFYTMVPIPQYAAYMRRAGAQGVIGKECEEAAVLQAMRGVLAGGTVFPGPASPRPSRVRRPVEPTPLSARETQVLQGLLDGRPLVAIAAELGVAVPSVTTYRRRILDKLGVATNAELIRRMGA